MKATESFLKKESIPTAERAAEPKPAQPQSLQSLSWKIRADASKDSMMYLLRSDVGHDGE